MKEYSLKKMVTLACAVDVLGLSHKNKSSNLSYLCRNGKIPGAYKAGNVWFIPIKWVDERKKK